MMRSLARALSLSAALAFSTSILACGGSSSGSTTVIGIGTITVSCIDLGDGTGTCTPLTPCVPDSFPSTPSEFIITGVNFQSTAGSTATVVFTATGGATPFLGGTSATAEVVANVLSGTQICGITPAVVLCGPPSVAATVKVILESGVSDDSTSGPSFTITFNAPVVTLLSPACVGSMISSTVTVTGTFFGPLGPVTIRLESADGQAIFSDGTATSIDVQGDVTVADTTITFFSPVVTNNVTAAVDPLQSVSDALELATLQVLLSNGSCSGTGGPGMTFSRPEGDEARNRNVVAGTFGGLDPVAGLRVPQTIATTIRILGTGDAGCPDPFAPVGGTVQVILSTPTGGPVNAFQLDSRDVGTANYDTVTGTIQSGTEIRFKTPRVRAGTSFTPVIRLVFEDGTIAPVVNGAPSIFTWNAPPAIGRGAAVGAEFLPAIANLSVGGGADVGILGAEPASTFLGASSSVMEITGTGFQPPVDGASPAPDIGPARVTLFDVNAGVTGPSPLDPESSGAPARRLGTGNPAVTTTANSAPAIGTGIEVGLGVESNLTGTGVGGIPDYAVTATTITGRTRLDGRLDELDTDLDGVVAIRVRVVNPDGQVSETGSWDPDGGFVRDMTYLLAHATPVNRTADPTATNNNVSVAIDPTSVSDLVAGVPVAANDFAFPRTSEALVAGNFGANLAIVSGNDSSAAFGFASTTIRLSFSQDGGLTWTDRVIGGAGGPGVTVADAQPVAATRNFANIGYDRFGNLWLSYLVSNSVAGTDRVIIGRSVTQGSTWAFVTLVDSLTQFGLGAGSLDRTAMAVGYASEPVFGDGQGTYVSFVDVASFPNRVFVSGLFTNALGFTPIISPVPVQVDTPGANPFMQHARPAVGPGGELYVSWLDFDPLFLPFTFRLMIDSDQDGLFASAFAFDSTVDPDLVVDGSIPFSASPRPASVDFGPLLPTPAITVVRAGADAGRIVVAYEEFSNSGSFQPQSLNLLTSYSDDFGFSWSTPQAVAAPAPNSTAADQFMPALATDDVTGFVYVTWYDTAVSAPAHDLTERWSAASEDGISWGAPVNLSAGTSSAPAGDGEFTDYGVHAGLAAYGGYVIAGWADNSALGGFMDAVLKLYQQSFEQTP